jgi:hypothetical protein
MRRDFSKLLCEDYRLTGGWRNSRLNLEVRAARRDDHLDIMAELQEDVDDVECDGAQSSSSTLRIRPRKQRKDLNENLTPLLRFLEGAEGRKWDDVYAELREVSAPTAVGLHVFEHLFSYVAVNTTIVGGKVVPLPSDRGGFKSLGRGPWAVHPQTGVLVRVEPIRRYALPKQSKNLTKLSSNMVKEGENVVFVRVNGKWHLVQVGRSSPYAYGAHIDCEEFRRYCSENDLHVWRSHEAKGRRLQRVVEFLRR